jgi:hypothetical protein
VCGSEKKPIPIALEVARGDLKTASHTGHRTPWQILSDFAATGDCNDLALWHEWEASTEGLHAIRWSNGLRGAVGLANELTDDEVVQAMVGGEVVYTFTIPQWNRLCYTRGARGKALRLAEESGTLGVARFMEELATASSRLAIGLVGVA